MSLSDINPQIDPGTDATVDSLSQSRSSGTDYKATANSITNTVIDNASSAVNAVKNHPVTQDIANGPVAQNVKKEAEQTSNEFSGLARSRAPPSYAAANGEQLTNYHSFFYTLLSWEHPRATGITFVSTLAFIFACRYLPVLKYILKLSYMILGVVTLAEASAKLVMGSSVASSVRPRNYYKIPKETLEASLDDLEQLINFFVIEFQRIVFAENIPATGTAFLAAFISYYLIKILPFWGLSLIFTCIVYLGPLVYISNKEVIDAQLDHATTVIGQQTAQVKDLAAQQTSKGLESVKAYTNEYTAKASEMVGTARQKIPIPGVAGTAQSESLNEGDFPAVPQTDLPSTAGHTKPIAHAPTEDGPIAASAH